MNVAPKVRVVEAAVDVVVAAAAVQAMAVAVAVVVAVVVVVVGPMDLVAAEIPCRRLQELPIDPVGVHFQT